MGIAGNFPFCGVGTALITPFSGGAIDYTCLERLIERQIDGGVDALLINGTTGESATLSENEARALIAFAVERADGRVPVVAGVGSSCTERAAGLAEYARDAGATAVLAVTPYYNKASERGLISHYARIANAARVPTIVYNVPSRTGLSLSVGIWHELLKINGICGVKEASGSISYVARLAARFGNDLAIYSGNDDLLLPTLSLGGMGIFSVISNLLPREVGDICRLYFSGDAEGARKLQLRLIPLIDAAFSEVNPIPIKAMLAECGLCREEYRLPLCSPTQEKRKIITDAMRALNI